MHPQVLGYGAALLATVIWAGNFVVARAFAAQIPPCQFNFWRWAIAFGAILPFALRVLWRDRAALCAHWRYLALMGLLGVTLMNTFIYKAGQSTESLNMAILMPATPVVVLLLSRICYGEPLSRQRVLGMLTAMVGICLLLSRGDFSRLRTLSLNSGDLWTLGGMVCFALYSLWMRQRPKDIAPLAFNAAVFGIGLVFALPSVALEAVLLPLPAITPLAVFGLCYAGLGCSAAAFWLWTLGIDRIGPVRASCIYYSLPIFAGIESVVLLGETVHASQCVGGALIIAGICAATLSKRPV